MPTAEADGHGTGGIDALPDCILEHILGLVPAEDAVRTSVLAPRWRHLWKSAQGLHIGCRDVGGPPGPVKECRTFVNHLLLGRKCSPVDTFEIRLGEFDTDDMLLLNLWVQYAILCKVRVLSLCSFSRIYLELYEQPLSWSLRRLELHGVRLHNSAADFSRCRVLEHLELHGCGMYGGTKIVCQSLRHLSIISSSFFDPSYECARVRICAPNLISLHLDDIAEMTPMLDRMLLLVKAFVRLTKRCDDYCCKDDADDDVHCVCQLCDSFWNRHSGGTSCVLLSGLSKAANLALISDPDVIIFRGDLRWCPTFSNLKKLLLNEYWCVPDFNALACILAHSPILEKLTLQLFSEGPMHKVEMKGGFSPMGPSARISEHLDTIEIKCEVVDERVLKVLKLLSTFNICFSCC